MKLRLTFLVLAALLLISALASAGPLSTPADPASASLAAIFSAPAAPEGPAAKLPSFEPARTDKTSLLCGTCSDAACTGAHQGDYCGYKNGKTYTCQFAYVTCSPRDCECWTGPLP
jgi:hypothetical protein